MFNEIVEKNYYSDDSIVRYMAQIAYHKEDIVNILYNSANAGKDDYKLKRKMWNYILKKEPNETKRNIFYLYFYERKRQAEISYLLDVSQAYISKALKKLINKMVRELN